MERRSSFSRDKVRIILKELTNHSEGSAFLKGLLLYISLAETAGRPFDEPRLVGGVGVIASSKRWPFHKSVVPLNIELRN
jgi:hypothetical protein